MTAPVCLACGKPSAFSLCSDCRAERQQHIRDKARRRRADWARRMTSKETPE